jgi:hypothetical protein
MTDISQRAKKKRRQPKKVDEATFAEMIKKTQLEGFNWIIEMPDYREHLVTMMLCEKNETQ